MLDPFIRLVSLCISTHSFDLDMVFLEMTSTAPHVKFFLKLEDCKMHRFCEIGRRGMDKIFMPSFFLSTL